VVAEQLPGHALLQEFLSEQRGGPVEVRVPQRGAARELVEQATQTAMTALRQARIEADFDAERTEGLLADLQARLDLPELPRRIECYDISNTMGTNSVGSMVVFEEGRPRPSHYRHFGIKTVEGANDFASMEETLRRRIGRHLGRAAAEDVPVDDPAGSNGGGRVAEPVGEEDALAVAEGPAEPVRRPRRRGTGAADDSFGVLPDLILIDGGKGQLGAAHAVLVENGLGHVPIAGLAKRNEELFLPGRPDPVVLPADSPTLFLVQRVRDEAHRFAITRHRARRGRAALRSRLDMVSGLGPARRRALLRAFGSLDGVREATVDEIAAVPGMPRSVALRIKELI
jgi:excinuclease ABC subunit C